MSASSVETSEGRVLRRWQPTLHPRAVIAVVHGYAEHSGRYERVGARLAGAGIAVWATDLRGHGGSSGERASVARLADLVSDACHLLDRARAASPGLRTFLLGHSMGGLVATRLLLDRQDDVAGLVLSGAALGDPSGLEALLAADPLPEVVLSSDLLATDPAVGRDYDADPLNYRGPFRRETLRALAAGAREVRARWGEIRCPVLVLHGGEDALVPARASAELFAHVASGDKELTVYPGLRHEILNEPSGPAIVDHIAGWVLARA